MFTIGGLSNCLALFKGYDRFILLSKNTTKCWKLLTMRILDVNIVKITYFVQSAGNLVNYLMDTIKTIVYPCTPETKRRTHKLMCFTLVMWEDIVHIINFLISFFFTNKYVPNHSNLDLRYSSVIRKISTENTSYNNNEGERLAYSFEENIYDQQGKLKPIKVYDNLKTDRIRIIKDCAKASGVYYLINNVNGHTYVGSSIDLANRVRSYLNNSYLQDKKNSNMPITKALLKYGHSNFSFLVLEHVDSCYLAVRETLYITKLLPYYNVLKTGYSSIGYKHTEETKAILTKLAKNRVHSPETKALIADALTGENNPFFGNSHSKESIREIIKNKSFNPVYIYDSYKNLIVIYPSVRTLSKVIAANHATIVKHINNNELFRGEWYFTNTPYNVEDTPKISDWMDTECEWLTKEIIGNIGVTKGVFVYDKNKKFIAKYKGVTEAGKMHSLSYITVKKCASVNGLHSSGYYFCFERLDEDWASTIKKNENSIDKK